jgi:cytochrome d ubiquinol oxidase subunit II
MFAYHGALWLEMKAEGELRQRARRAAFVLWPAVLGMVLIFLALTAAYTNTFQTAAAYPIVYLPLVLAVVGLVASRLCLQNGVMIAAWLTTALFLLGVTFFGVGGMFPNLIISSLDPAFSVTLFNGGASSPLTLKIMLIAALCAVPIVIIYQAWVYYTFSHRITQEELASDHAY